MFPKEEESVHSSVESVALAGNIYGTSQFTATKIKWKPSANGVGEKES